MLENDDDYLKSILNLGLEEFKNQIIIDKVSKINCNFVDYIIKNSPKHISYLDEYYRYFNQKNINIIKNTKNNQDQLLYDYYCNINTENLEESVIEHISNFIKSHKLTDNIINLFNIDIDRPVKKNNDLKSIKYDVDQNKQEILHIKKEILELKSNIDNIKNDLYNKIDNIISLISLNTNNSK